MKDLSSLEFFSGALKKTHSTCKHNVRWCESYQHVQTLIGNTFFLKIDTTKIHFINFGNKRTFVVIDFYSIFYLLKTIFAKLSKPSYQILKSCPPGFVTHSKFFPSTNLSQSFVRSFVAAVAESKAVPSSVPQML